MKEISIKGQNTTHENVNETALEVETDAGESPHAGSKRFRSNKIFSIHWPRSTRQAKARSLGPVCGSVLSKYGIVT